MTATLALFQQGEDLPLFTGTPIPVIERRLVAPIVRHVDNETLPGWCVRCCMPLAGRSITWTDDGPLCPDCF